MIRRFLPLMLMAVLAAPAVLQAQTVSPCTGTTWVAPPSGGVSGSGCSNDQYGLAITVPMGSGAPITVKRSSTAPVFGSMTWATDYGTTAIGAQAWAGSLANNNSSPYASAYGFQSQATATQSTALGASTLAAGYSSLAAGFDAWSQGQYSIALLGTASADYTIAIGQGAGASGLNALSIGYLSVAAAPNSMAFGFNANIAAGATGSVGFSPLNGPTLFNPTQGQVTRAGVFDVGGRQISSVAAGTLPTDAVNLQQLDAAIAGIPTGGSSAPVWLASTDTTTAASALGTNGTAVGAGANAGNASTSYNTAIGGLAQAGTQGTAQAGTGGQDTAVGYGASATGIGAESFGYQASATAPFSTAIGNYALADQINTVSFGNATTGVTRRLVNVSPGINSSDAMTMGQGQTVTSIFGAGANLLTSTAPTYVFTSPYAAGTYYDVGSALTALDNGQNALWNAFNNLPSGGGSPGPVGPQGPAGSNATVTAGNNIEVTQNAAGQDVVSTNPNMSLTSVTTTDGKGNTTVTSGNGVSITSASGDNVSITTAGLDNGNNVITGVANGQVSSGSTQAVNGGQLFQAQVAANAYTDQQVGAVKNWAQAYTDAKVSGLSDQINRTGAASAAMSNVEYRDFRNSFGVGLGWQGGHNGVAVGFRHVSDDGSYEWHVKAAISGAVRSIGVGMSWGWN